MPLQSIYHCRMCATELLPDDDFCPKCGVQGMSVASRSSEPRTRDIVLSVVFGGIALGSSILFTWPAIVAGLAGFSPDYIWGTSLIAALYNGLVIGFPLAVITWRWYSLAGQPGVEHHWIWHTYWRLQLMIFALLILAVLLGSICAGVMFGLFHR